MNIFEEIRYNSNYTSGEVLEEGLVFFKTSKKLDKYLTRLRSINVTDNLANKKKEQLIKNITIINNKFKEAERTKDTTKYDEAVKEYKKILRIISKRNFIEGLPKIFVAASLLALATVFGFIAKDGIEGLLAFDSVINKTAGTFGVDPEKIAQRPEIMTAKEKVVKMAVNKSMDNNSTSMALAGGGLVTSILTKIVSALNKKRYTGKDEELRQETLLALKKIK